MSLVIFSSNEKVGQRIKDFFLQKQIPVDLSQQFDVFDSDVFKSTVPCIEAQLIFFTKLLPIIRCHGMPVITALHVQHCYNTVDETWIANECYSLHLSLICLDYNRIFALWSLFQRGEGLSLFSG